MDKWLGFRVMMSKTVYDHDMFNMDDKMGDAEFEIKTFVEAIRMKLEGLPDGTIVTKSHRLRTNCLSEESCVMFKEGKVVQDMCLRLRNAECGENLIMSVIESDCLWIAS